MYIIINSKNVIAEICAHPCYVRTQKNGVTILSERDKADEIYSNDTDTYYPVKRMGGVLDAHRVIDVGEIPEDVKPGYIYENGGFTPGTPQDDEESVWDELAAAYTEGVNSIDE